MAITFRSASYAVGTGGNVTMSEPSGAAENDIFIGFISGAASASYSLPSGWTTLYSGQNSGIHAWLVGIIRRGSSAPDLTFGVSSSVFRECLIVAYSGVDTTTAIDAQSVAGNSGTGNPGYPNPPSVIATIDDAFAVTFGVRWNGGGIWVAPSGYTLRNGAADGIAFADRQLTSAGTEDPGAFSGSQGGLSRFWNGATIALRPATGGGTPPTFNPAWAARSTITLQPGRAA